MSAAVVSTVYRERVKCGQRWRIEERERVREKRRRSAKCEVRSGIRVRRECVRERERREKRESECTS